MTQINNQGVPGAANPAGQPGSTGQRSTGSVDQADADDFANMMDGDDATSSMASQDADETAREEFKDLFRRNSFRQFLEQSKKLMDEARKNTDG